MKFTTQSGIIGTALLMVGLLASASAKADTTNGSFWQIAKDPGTFSLTVPGQPAPVITKVLDTTIFSGICQDCMLPLDFPATQSAKSCSVCGCAVNNATCIAGKPVKDGTWQSMLKLLPNGTGLVPVYVDPAKPESGLAKLTFNLRSVILQVSGLNSLTPDQLLALAKPLGATKAELLDSGKILSITLKVDYTADKAAKLQKAIEAAKGKVGAPDAA